MVCNFYSNEIKKLSLYEPLNKIVFLLLRHQIRYMATCHFLWQDKLSILHPYALWQQHSTKFCKMWHQYSSTPKKC